MMKVGIIMATYNFAGGVDLKFPHHDNELAQSEAHYNNDHWVSECKQQVSLSVSIIIINLNIHHSLTFCLRS